jgi:peptide deformylase
MYKSCQEFLNQNKTLKVLKEPEDNDILKKVSLPIENKEGVLELSQQMFNLMYQSNGIGLASPQIGLNLRMFVIHIPASEKREETKIVAVNPLILKKDGKASIEEGCLSVRDRLIEVVRSKTIEVSYEDEHGVKKTQVLDGLASICFQHELDHLDGILISDYEITEEFL